MSYFVWGRYGWVEVDYRVNDGLLPRRRIGGSRWHHPHPQHWHDLRKAALDRDGWRCVLCNSRRRLNVHHRTYERWGEELLDDVYTLCRCCHVWHHKKKRGQAVNAV